MGQRSRILLVGLACALFAGCSSPAEDQRASAYFLWAGVEPPAELADAETVYILAGEVRASDPSRLVQLRPTVPQGGGADIWMVVRAERLDWSEDAYRRIERDLARWAAQNRLAGLQVDFDAATLGLDSYADFLTQLRERLPGRYALSVTGLMDWSAHGDPQALARLGGVIDEIVIQTYQGQQTISGHEQYLGSLKELPLPYRIGIVRDGKWKAPAWLADDPEYRGEVVFLTNR